jgi:hypothetical protein
MRTPGITRSLQSELEALSAYRPAFLPGSGNEAYNPTNYAHRTIVDGRKRWQVISRIVYNGVDYTGRNNHFAHHVLFPASAGPAPGPAWLASRKGFLDTKWHGQVEVLPNGRQLPPNDGGGEPGVCRHWEAATGDAGWGGRLVEAFLEGPNLPCYLIFRCGQAVLPLLVEALALVPAAKRWDVTFSTYFTVGGKNDCLWRCVLESTPEAEQALRGDRSRCFDLRSRNLGPAPTTAWTTYARSGQWSTQNSSAAPRPAAVAPAAAVAPSAARNTAAIVPKRSTAPVPAKVPSGLQTARTTSGNVGNPSKVPIDDVEGSYVAESLPPPLPLPQPRTGIGAATILIAGAAFLFGSVVGAYVLYRVLGDRHEVSHTAVDLGHEREEQALKQGRGTSRRGVEDEASQPALDNRGVVVTPKATGTSESIDVDVGKLTAAGISTRPQAEPPKIALSPLYLDGDKSQSPIDLAPIGILQPATGKPANKLSFIKSGNEQWQIKYDGKPLQTLAKKQQALWSLEGDKPGRASCEWLAVLFNGGLPNSCLCLRDDVTEVKKKEMDVKVNEDKLSCIFSFTNAPPSDDILPTKLVLKVEQDEWTATRGDSPDGDFTCRADKKPDITFSSEKRGGGSSPCWSFEKGKDKWKFTLKGSPGLFSNFKGHDVRLISADFEYRCRFVAAKDAAGGDNASNYWLPFHVRLEADLTKI